MVNALAPGAAVRVRHYCQGIGDCHLLRFQKEDGSPFWMLIDCGVHSSVKGGSNKIRDIAADIADVVDRKLDVLVVTHEHWDHVSGFLVAAETFGSIEVGEVWMAWTEDPKDPQARRLDEFKGNALTALQLTSARLNGVLAPSSLLESMRTEFDTVLGFNFGAAGERVRRARDNAVALGRKVRYFDPAATEPLTVEGVPNLRIFVLGPPRDERLLGITDRPGEHYGFGAARAMAGAFGLDAGGGGLDDAAPFESSLGIPLAELGEAAETGGKGIDERTALFKTLPFARDHYFGPRGQEEKRRGASLTPDELDQAWQRIDADWLSVSSTLALQLDNLTNNTSLALAFEIRDCRVLLFAADAQVGNWQSWQDLKWTVDGKEVTGPDLLARTVYYKVGHHGSENATPKAKGLEQMIDQDLAAFIPVNARDAERVGWGRMPLAAMLEVLERKTAGRVLRADDPWIATDTIAPGFQWPSGSIRALSYCRDLWIECDLA